MCAYLLGGGGGRGLEGSGSAGEEARKDTEWLLTNKLGLTTTLSITEVADLSPGGASLPTATVDEIGIL